jgi:thioredoxin reductase (NADPH)
MRTRRPGDPHDVLVIGGGLAGLTAAHRAALLGLRVASLDDGGHMGGLVMNIGRIDGYPAEGAVSGIEVAVPLLESILALGVEIVPERATKLELDGEIKIVTTDGGVHEARTVVMASGARLKTLGVPGEKALFGRGVSQCAACDAGFFTDQEVVVVGGGDSALQEALHLSDHASAITLVIRGDTLRARRGYVERAMANPKFKFRWSTQVVEIRGGDGVEGVRLAPTGGGGAEELACSGVFVFVGLEPNARYAPNAIERNADGFIVTDPGFRTSVPGIHAIGAVRAGYSGRLADAVAEAATVVAGMPSARGVQ